MKDPHLHIIDLHLDSFIWKRLFGYDLTKRHKNHFAQGLLFGQVDLPRLREAGITGAMWSITTNPFRRNFNRSKTFDLHFKNFTTWVESQKGGLKLITKPSEVTKSVHSVWLVVQGGNAFANDVSVIDLYAPVLTRVTLMHLTHSQIGTSSSPYPAFRTRGLTETGHALVHQLNKNRVFVDLAHADQATFWDAVKTHDASQPLMVSHTGVTGVYPHWRNLDDAQIKAVANTGGVIGVLYHAGYLGPTASQNGPAAIVNHLEHIQKVAGDDCTALGSDWDGFIIPAKGLRNCTKLPTLIQEMESRKWSTARIEKTLGQNFLRAFKQLRPEG